MIRDLIRAKTNVEAAFQQTDRVWKDDLRRRFETRSLDPALVVVEAFISSARALEAAVEAAEHAVGRDN